MIELDIPGMGHIEIKHIVSDVNGTLAIDGQLMMGVPRLVANLQKHLEIHLLTADTHGKQRFIDQQLGLNAVRITPGNEALQKAEYVKKLGAHNVAAIGQGANDAMMVEVAAIGICVLSFEGVAIKTMNAAKLITPDIISALELFEYPLRLVASLRQ